VGVLRPWTHPSDAERPKETPQKGSTVGLGTRGGTWGPGAGQEVPGVELGVPGQGWGLGAWLKCLGVSMESQNGARVPGQDLDLAGVYQGGSWAGVGAGLGLRGGAWVPGRGLIL
jgi:hypothetical protein